jgi:hypothetical protein
MAKLVGKTMLSGALAATLAAPVWAQTLPDLPLFSGEAVFLDPYNELLDHMTPKKLRPSMFPVVQIIAMDIQLGPRLTDLDAYNGTLAVLADGVRRKVDAMSAYAFVPGHRTLRVWEVPATSEGK